MGIRGQSGICRGWTFREKGVLRENALVCILAVAAFAFHICSLSCAAADYKVGGTNGWNAGLTRAGIDAWVANITFRVNDTLFFQYIPVVHNVLEVNQADYQVCTNSSPIRTYTDGSTTVLLGRPGGWYFIDGISNYCALEGVKIAVDVQAVDVQALPGGPQKKKSSSKTGVIVGVSIAVAVALLVFAVGITCCLLRRKGGQEDIEGKALNSEVHLTCKVAMHKLRFSWVQLFHVCKCIEAHPHLVFVDDFTASVPGKDHESAGAQSSEVPNVSSGTPGHQRAVLDTIHVRPYTLAQIKEITANFDKKIGQGGYGPVFYGKLSNGNEVAVKVCSGDSQQGENEFINEVKLLSLVHHKNIVPLVGYCQEDNEQILLYEYMHGGDLRNRLDGSDAEQNLLTWRDRLSIALDAARGLEYLHTGASSLPIIHRDIKASNILLTHKLVAKVADFGLSKLAPSEDITHISTHVKGTAGYLDPEYYVSRQLTEGSDVYSFGVLLLELVSGRPPIFQLTPGTNSGIVEWVKVSLQSATIENIVDPRLGGDFEVDSVWKLVEIGLQCVDIQRQSRPSMSAVVREVKQAFNIELGNASSDRSNAIATFINRAAANRPPSRGLGNDSTGFNSPVNLPVIRSQVGTSSQDNSDQADDTYQPTPR